MSASLTPRNASVFNLCVMLSKWTEIWTGLEVEPLPLSHTVSLTNVIPLYHSPEWTCCPSVGEDILWAIAVQSII